MDYHFLFKYADNIGKLEKSFNPCFNGLSFLIEPDKKVYENDIYMFQSLF